MFRKLTDRLSSAANAAANALAGSDEQGVQALQSMGFSAEAARNALQATNGNVDRAAELLLSNGPPQFESAPVPQSLQTEDALDKALQESRQAAQAEEARQIEAARKASAAAAKKKPPQSAAATRAGKAAVARVANGATPFAPNKSTVCEHHPQVKVPKRLSHKPKEEQLLRCADRLKNYPRAVDTLYIALTSIQKDPANPKFRTVKKDTPGYQRSLAKAPGAEDMFKAMNFVVDSPNTLVLHRDRVDPALLYLGISALDQTRQTPEYQQGKLVLKFEKEIQQLFAAEASDTEAIQRANFLSKCPAEPSDGRGALMQVKIADRDPVRRKFDGDDTLEDVLNWLGGHASVIPEKVLTREWSLIDMNRYPLAPTDCEEDRHKTLQYLGLFPSGKLEIQASSEEWQTNKSLGVKAGSSRGLGAARTDH